MASKTVLTNLNKIYKLSIIKRSYSLNIVFTEPKTNTKSSHDVEGLTSNCVKVPNNPVGPGAAKNTGYKNPEYFCYDKTSYFEAEVEMLKYRCPQPSVNVPYIISSK